MQKSYFRQKSTTFEQRQLSNPVPIQHKIHYYFIKYKTHFFLSLQQQNKVLAKTRRKKKYFITAEAYSAILLGYFTLKGTQQYDINKDYNHAVTEKTASKEANHIICSLGL